MTCPICAKPGDAVYRPFCSKRCADVDLAKWLGGTYRVPSQEPLTGDEAEAALAERPDKPH